MSKIKSRDTEPEMVLRRALWHMGLRYKTCVKELPGKPDIFFNKSKLVVFVDGAFWHGYKLTETRLNMLPEYWKNKITKNSERDVRIDNSLKSNGYRVLRILDTDIKRNLEAVAHLVYNMVRNPDGINSISNNSR